MGKTLPGLGELSASVGRTLPGLRDPTSGRPVSLRSTLAGGDAETTDRPDGADTAGTGPLLEDAGPPESKSPRLPSAELTAEARLSVGTAVGRLLRISETSLAKDDATGLEGSAERTSDGKAESRPGGEEGRTSDGNAESRSGGVEGSEEGVSPPGRLELEPKSTADVVGSSALGLARGSPGEVTAGADEERRLRPAESDNEAPSDCSALARSPGLLAKPPTKPERTEPKEPGGELGRALRRSDATDAGGAPVTALKSLGRAVGRADSAEPRSVGLAMPLTSSNGLVSIADDSGTLAETAAVTDGETAGLDGEKSGGKPLEAKADRICERAVASGRLDAKSLASADAKGALVDRPGKMSLKSLTAESVDRGTAVGSADSKLERASGTPESVGSPADGMPRDGTPEDGRPGDGRPGESDGRPIEGVGRPGDDPPRDGSTPVGSEGARLDSSCDTTSSEGALLESALANPPKLVGSWLASDANGRFVERRSDRSESTCETAELIEAKSLGIGRGAAVTRSSGPLDSGSPDDGRPALTGSEGCPRTELSTGRSLATEDNAGI